MFRLYVVSRFVYTRTEVEDIFPNKVFIEEKVYEYEGFPFL